MDEQTARQALLDAPGTVMLGHTLAGETILALLDEHYPGRHFCLGPVAVLHGQP